MPVFLSVCSREPSLSTFMTSSGLLSETEYPALPKGAVKFLVDVESSTLPSSSVAQMKREPMAMAMPAGTSVRRLRFIKPRVIGHMVVKSLRIEKESTIEWWAQRPVQWGWSVGDRSVS